MAGKKIEGLGGKDGLRVEISVESDPYQAFLAAQKERERLREENGGDTVEGVELVRKAAAEVGRHALQEFRKGKTN